MGLPSAEGEAVIKAWPAYVKKDPEEQVFDQYRLLDWLKSGKSFIKKGGESIRGTIEFAKNTTVKSMSATETLAITHLDPFDRYNEARKHYGGDLVITQEERDQISGGEGIFDLIAAKIANLRSSFFDKFNADLFSDGTANSSKGFGGLQHVVSSTPTTGTVHGISRNNFSFWRNQQTLGTKTSTAYDDINASLRTSYNDCSKGLGEATPNIAFGTQTDVEGYEGTLVSLERYMRRGVKDKGISGFTGEDIMFKDIPYVWDADCPSGTTYLLNNRNLKLVYASWMKFFPNVTPTNQFISVGKVWTSGNLVSDNPRRLGVVTVIT